MFKKSISYFMVFALMISALTYSPSMKKDVAASVANPTAPGWNLVWSDEFNGNSLDTGSWSYNTGTGDWGWGNGEIQYYTNREDNVKVSDGYLKLIAKKENYNGSKYTSGRIYSKNKREFQYGKMEAKIKIENGNQAGVWPAFWMQGNDGSSWPACGELDIMEHRNSESNVIGTIHWGTSNSTHQYWGSESTATYGTPYTFSDNVNNGINGWHTYGVTWDADTIKWYVDDEVFQIAYLNSKNQDYFRKNYFFILNLALGGTGTPFTLYTSVPDNFKTTTMYVDYVRAYSYDGSGETTTTDIPEGYTKSTNGSWQDVGAWQYYFGQSWAGCSGAYKGGTTLNDFSIYMKKASSQDWGAKIKPDLTLEANKTYYYDMTIKTDADGDAFRMVRDLNGSGKGTLVSPVLSSGTNTYSGSFTTGTDVGEEIVFNLSNISAGKTFTIKSFSLTDNPPTNIETTTTDLPAGYLPSVTADSSWHDIGAWQYYLSSGANGKLGYKDGQALNNVSIYIKKKASYDWGAQIKPDLTFSPNTTYNYSLTVDTDAEGNTFKMNKDLNGSGTKLIDQILANGINTFSGSFTTGSSGSESLNFDLAKLSSGKTFTVTSFSVTKATATTAEVTTKATPTTTEPTTREVTTEPEATTKVPETTTKTEVTTKAEITTPKPFDDPYANLNWVNVSGSDGKYQVASLEDFGINSSYMNGSSEILIIPRVNAGTYKIWPAFSNETYNGLSGVYSEGAGVHIPVAQTIDNSYNIYTATSSVQERTFHIIIKSGTPASAELPTSDIEPTTSVETTTAAEETTVEETTEDYGIEYTYTNNSWVKSNRSEGILSVYGGLWTDEKRCIIGINYDGNDPYSAPINVTENTQNDVWLAQIEYKITGLTADKPYKITTTLDNDIVIHEAYITASDTTYQKKVDVSGTLPLGRYNLSVSYEEIVNTGDVEVQDITIVPNVAKMDENGNLWANWTNPSGTVKAYAYFNEVSGNKGVATKNNGWIFNSEATQPMKSVDKVARTKDGTVKVVKGGTYKLIVEAFDVFDRKIGYGEKYITVGSEIAVNMDVAPYKSGETYTAPEKEGYVFAGWYEDESCETVYTGTTGTAYARFIDKNLLSVKFQWANDKTAIRFLSTMDHTNYREVGFIINGTYGTGTITNKKRSVTKLFRSIIAANKSVYPTVFSAISNYFFTYTVREMDPSLASTWSITPYFVTPDGTTVTGITGNYPAS